MIYFIQDSETCEIKIGFTEGDPVDRLASLQTGNPHLLVLIHSESGGRVREVMLHQMFAGDRVRGEWFRPGPLVLKFLISAASDEGHYEGWCDGTASEREAERAAKRFAWECDLEEATALCAGIGPPFRRGV